MSLTLSISLNCSLTDRSRSKTMMLPLAWLTIPLGAMPLLPFVARWQAIKNALTLTGMMGRSLAWGLGV